VGACAPYPGPIGSVVSPGLLGENYVQLAQASSLCGACKDACPVDIDLPMLLTRVRAGAASDPPSGTSQLSVTSDQSQGNGLPALLKFGLRMYTRLATHPGLFAVSQRLAGLGARLVSPILGASPFSAWMKFPAFTGWGYSKDFPRPASKPFRARWKDSRRQVGGNTGTQVERDISIQVEKDTRTQVETEQETPVAQFTAELIALGGHVIECTALELSGHLLTFLRERGIERVQAWETVPGVDWAAITEAGISVEKEADESIKAGVTGALAGVAETGTLVIPGGAGRPLTASLLPEIHIAVLRASDIAPNLEAAFQRPEITDAPATVLVSGPSRTADIEMTLTIGVHGPGELRVFILREG
jgi:L-lactate utilization protein LutC